MSFKMVPFEILGAVFYSPSIVIMALSGIISEIKRNIGRKSCFYISLCPDPGAEPRSDLRVPRLGHVRAGGSFAKLLPPGLT